MSAECADGLRKRALDDYPRLVSPPHELSIYQLQKCTGFWSKKSGKIAQERSASLEVRNEPSDNRSIPCMSLDGPRRLA
jgi:hypothetical protein